MPTNDVTDWTQILPVFLRMPIAVYTNRHLFQKWWKHVAEFTDIAHTNVGILGRSTVGKSVLLSHLHGEAAKLSWDLPGVSSKVETKIVSLGTWAKTVRVIPGQSSRDRHIGLRETFDSPGLEGLIYVADWGFTDFRDDTFKDTLIKEKKITTIAQLRDYNLNKELEDFSDICRKIAESYALEKRVKWLMIAVNKSDLYLNELSQAQSYYHTKTDSPFSKILMNLLQEIGENNLRIDFAPICSYPEDFSWGQEFVETQIRGFDEQRAFTRNFFEKIAKLTSN